MADAKKKNRPVTPAGSEPQKPQTLDDLSMFVLDEDLKAIAMKDKEDIYQCLLVQSCRGGNKSVNSIIAAARAIS